MAQREASKLLELEVIHIDLGETQNGCDKSITQNNPQSIPKGVFVAVAEVEPDGVRLDNGMRLKNQELLRATRPSHAVTYASCQGLTLHNRVRLDLQSCHGARVTAMRLLWLMTKRSVRPPGLGRVELLQPRLGLLQRGARLLADPQPLHEVEDAGVGAHVLRELVPVPGQVADELAVLQRRADGPPGPGVQHGRQLPEVSQQQELHVGVQPHAGQLLRTAPAHVPAHPVVGRLRPQAQVLRGAVRAAGSCPPGSGL